MMFAFYLSPASVLSPNVTALLSVLVVAVIGIGFTVEVAMRHPIVRRFVKIGGAAIGVGVAMLAFYFDGWWSGVCFWF